MTSEQEPTEPNRFEALVRSISEGNKQRRADFQRLSARVVALSMHGTQEEIDEFYDSLEGEFHQVLEGTGKDPAVGGADGSTEPDPAVVSEPPQPTD